MTTIELNNQKMNLIKDILDETNADIIIDMMAYIRKIKAKSRPCCFTDKEKKERIEQSVRDAGMGIGVSQKMMLERHPKWK